MNFHSRSLNFSLAALIAIGIWLVLADRAPSHSNDNNLAGPADGATRTSDSDNDTAVFADNSSTGSLDNVHRTAKTDKEKEEQYTPKTKRELRRILSPIEYEVTQMEATEPAFRNRYWNHKQDGIYKCIVCGQDLFTSETKYKSGTGWPSFYAPINIKNVGLRKDWRLIYARTEVHCSRCNAHLGHVFDDGPQPTGKRYCMNSASLTFAERQKGSSESAVDAKPGE